MTVKELKEALNKIQDDTQEILARDSFNSYPWIHIHIIQETEHGVILEN